VLRASTFWGELLANFTTTLILRVTSGQRILSKRFPGKKCMVSTFGGGADILKDQLPNSHTQKYDIQADRLPRVDRSSMSKAIPNGEKNQLRHSAEQARSVTFIPNQNERDQCVGMG